jgi:hypothetical protein
MAAREIKLLPILGFPPPQYGHSSISFRCKILALRER